MCSTRRRVLSETEPPLMTRETVARDTPLNRANSSMVNTTRMHASRMGALPKLTEPQPGCQDDAVLFRRCGSDPDTEPICARFQFKEHAWSLDPSLRASCGVPRRPPTRSRGLLARTAAGSPSGTASPTVSYTHLTLPTLYSV